VPDVSRALLLPDWAAPSDTVLKSLALYWDEIVVPDSTFRDSPVIRLEDLNDPPPRSDATLALEAAGVVKRHPTDIAAESFMPHPRAPNEDSEGIILLRIEDDDRGRTRFTQTLRIDPANLVNAPTPKRRDSPEDDPDRDVREATAALHADTLLERARQSRELAVANNLAPVAPSLLSHLASLTTDEAEYPMIEGALLGVALDAFMARSDTPVEAIIEFRDRHVRAIQRFRAAMTDLGALLRQADIAPEAALAAARDVYRNRVEPDLAALEARLSESRIKFLTRSMFGAAALAVTPLTAPTVTENAVRLGAQTINYRFSRDRLVEEHPYSYLHRLSTADFVIPSQLTGPDLVSPELTPADAVHRQYEALFEISYELQKKQDESGESP
jgi:hypothetical protein